MWVYFPISSCFDIAEDETNFGLARVCLAR